MSKKPTSPETLYGTGRDYLREQIKTNEILADIAGVEYTPPEGVPKGKYMENKWLLDAAEKKNELLEEIAEGGPGGGSAAAKAIGIDYATDGIFLKNKNGDTIQGSGATLPAYGVTFDPATGGLTLTKNGTAVQGQTVTIPNYGSPVGVDASADMTDHDKIYLYLGTTGGGYTNGHFYYWDGTAWADGGEYAAATVQTDKTLLVEDRAADAKATGDAINSVKTQISLFEIPLTVGYYLDTSGNAVANATNVFSVSDFYNFTSKDRFEIFDFVNLSYASYALGYAFYDKDKRFIDGAGDFNGDLSSDTLTIPANTEYVRFCTRTEYATNARVYINEQGGAVYKLEALRNAPTILELLRFDLVPGKYIDTNGQEVVNATNQFSATDFCAFTENDKFELFGFYSSLYASYALAYAFYDDDKKFISGTGNLDGDLSSQSITIPQNTAYVRFCTRTEFVPNAKVYVNNSIGYIEKIEPLKQEVSDSLKKSEMETEIGLNKFDYTKVTTGKEIYSDGTLNTQLNSAVSDFIPVYGKTKIYLKNLPTYPVADVERYCYFYNSAKEPIGTVLYIGKTVSATDISVPSGAYYFRFSVYQRVPSETLPVDYNSVMVTTEFTNIEFEPYGEFVSSIDGYDIPKNSNKGLNVSGLKVLIFGDSITETASMNDDGTGYVEGTRNNWPKYANDIMGWSSFKNYAKSGAAYKVRAGVEYRQTVANQIALAMADSNNDDADIVIFSLGTNDGATDLGSYETAMSKTTLASLDQTKLYEALRFAYWTVKTKYKNAMCFAAIPIQRADIEPPTALYQAITEMAHRYNFIVIDAAYQSGIIKENNTWEASGNDLYDGLHPNTVGQTKIANLYSSVMMEHLLYKSN